VGIGTTSQHVTGTSIQLHLCKSNGRPKTAQMPLLPKSDVPLALRRKVDSDLQNLHQNARTGCFSKDVLPFLQICSSVKSQTTWTDKTVDQLK